MVVGNRMTGHAPTLLVVLPGRGIDVIFDVENLACMTCKHSFGMASFGHDCGANQHGKHQQQGNEPTLHAGANTSRRE